MREKLVIIPRKKKAGQKVWVIVFFALACLCLLFSMFVSSIIFSVPAVLFCTAWFLTAFRSAVEYEYTYYDGEFCFAKIKNKSRRKRIAVVNMEDVIVIAPKGDRAVYKYENDKSVILKQLTSGNADAKIYEMVSKGEKAMVRYEFEPDKEMLDEIMVKYPRIVTM